MSIYTRRGDAGHTSLGDGSRVPKSSARVEAYGSVDEANSAVGLARAATDDPLLDDALRFIQNKLLNCSSTLALPPVPQAAAAAAVTAEDIEVLENGIDLFEQRCDPLEGFILEGGSEAAARLHVARATLRRAERCAVALAATEHVDEHVLAFLNRASDTLFAAARYANKLAGTGDEPWDPHMTLL